MTVTFQENISDVRFFNPIHQLTKSQKEAEECAKWFTFIFPIINKPQNTFLAEDDDVITISAAGTFTSTRYLGNSSGYFDVPLISFDKDENENDDDSIEQSTSQTTLNDYYE